jgi:hypothetical protein
VPELHIAEASPEEDNEGLARLATVSATAARALTPARRSRRVRVVEKPFFTTEKMGRAGNLDPNSARCWRFECARSTGIFQPAGSRLAATQTMRERARHSTMPCLSRFRFFDVPILFSIAA